MKKLWHLPGDLLVAHTSARDRRSFAAWTFIASCVAAPFLGDYVWFVTVISLLALLANITSETPVEAEVND